MMSQREKNCRQQQRKRSLEENERLRLGWRLNEFCKLTVDLPRHAVALGKSRQT